MYCGIYSTYVRAERKPQCARVIPQAAFFGNIKQVGNKKSNCVVDEVRQVERTALISVLYLR